MVLDQVKITGTFRVVLQKLFDAVATNDGWTYNNAQGMPGDAYKVTNKLEELGLLERRKETSEERMADSKTRVAMRPLRSYIRLTPDGIKEAQAVLDAAG